MNPVTSHWAVIAANTPVAITLCAAPIALVDVAMLLMWLCYFGYSKVGALALMLPAPMPAGPHCT